MWFALQIALMVIGTVAVYIYRPDDEWVFLIAPIAGFCFAYWVTWAIFKIIDAPTRVRRLVHRAKALWF